MSNEEVALILEPKSPFPVAEVGRVLSDHLGIPQADATSRVRYCGGLILESASEEEAARVASRLGELNVSTRAIAAHHLYTVPRGTKARSLEFLDDALLVRRASGSEWVVIRDDILGMYLHGVPTDRSWESPEPAGQGKRAAGRRPRALPLEAFEPVPGTGLSPRAREVLERMELAGLRGLRLRLTLYAVEPAGPIRIHQGDFSFSCLGEQKQEQSLDNFLLLVEEVLDYLPRAWNRQPAVEFLESLDPRRIACFKEEEAANFDRWMLQWVRLAREDQEKEIAT